MANNSSNAHAEALEKKKEDIDTGRSGRRPRHVRSHGKNGSESEPFNSLMYITWLPKSWNSKHRKRHSRILTNERGTGPTAESQDRNDTSTASGGKAVRQLTTAKITYKQS